MFNPETLLLGLALAIDASVVSFAIGLLNEHSKRSVKLARGGLTALTFGFFQFFMLWLGSLGGYLFSFSNYGYLFPLVVSLIFLALSIKFFRDSFDVGENKVYWGLFPMLLLGLITSIDAMASGISLGTLPQSHMIALDIGVVTFVLCASSFSMAQFFRSLPGEWLLRLAGTIFLGLAGNSIWSTFFKGNT